MTWKTPIFHYNRQNRVLIITGAVAAELAADVAADIREIYEEYRLDPNFETLADLQDGMVHQTQKSHLFKYHRPDDFRIGPR